MVAWGGVIHESIVNHPPRGTTMTLVRMGDKRMRQWTYLCPVDGCWAVAYSDISEESAKTQVASHACPAPLRRGMIGGRSLLENMWDTADEAIDALHANTFYLTDDMVGEKLKGYIAGIAEMISYAAIPYFRIPEDVLREMQRRWKMRQHQIPFSPTPSYRYNPPPPEMYNRNEGPAARKPAETKTPAGRAPRKITVKAAQIAAPLVTDPQRKVIKETHAAGMSIPDLAKAFGVPEFIIERIVTPQQIVIGGLL